MADSRIITKEKLIDPEAIPGIKKDLEDLRQEIALTTQGIRDMAAAMQKNAPSNIPKTSEELKDFQTNLKKSEVLQNGLTEAQKRALEVNAQYAEILRQEKAAAKDRNATIEAGTNSIIAMRIELKNMTAELNKMDVSTEAYKKQEKAVGDLSNKIGQLEQAAGNYHRQVGKYSAALNGYGESIRKVTELTRGMTGITSILLRILGVDREIVQSVTEVHGALREAMRSESEVRRGLTSETEAGTAATVENTEATEAQTVANEEEAASGIAAIPIIGGIALALAAVGIAIWAYISSSEKARKEEEERTKTIDGLSIADEKMRQSYNESLKVLNEIDLSYKVFNGTLSETQAKIESLAFDNKIAMQEISNETAKKLQDVEGFWHSLWNVTKDYFTLQSEGSHSAAEAMTIDYEQAEKANQSLFDTHMKQIQAEIDGYIKMADYIAKVVDETKKLNNEFKELQDKGAIDHSDHTLTGERDADMLGLKIGNTRSKADLKIERDRAIADAKGDKDKLILINREFAAKSDIIDQEYTNAKKERLTKYNEDEKKARIKAEEDQIKANKENLDDFIKTEQEKVDALQREIEQYEKLTDKIQKNQEEFDKLNLRRLKLNAPGAGAKRGARIKSVNDIAQGERDVAVGNYDLAQSNTDKENTDAIAETNKEAQKAKDLGVYNQADFDKQKAAIDKNFQDESTNNLYKYNLDVRQINKDQAEAIKKIKQQETEEEIKQMQESLKAAEQIAEEKIALAKNALDVQTEMLKTQAEVQATLAGEGKQNSLDATLAAEAKAGEQEKELARKQKETQEAAQYAQAFLSSYNSLVKAGKSPQQAIEGALLAIGEVKALTIGLAAAFFEGTPDTGKGGNLDAKGGFFAMLHPEEAVIPKKRNKEEPGLAKAWIDGNLEQFVMDRYLPKLDFPEVNNAIFHSINNKLEAIEKNTKNPPMKTAYTVGKETVVEELRDGNIKTRVINELPTLRM